MVQTATRFDSPALSADPQTIDALKEIEEIEDGFAHVLDLAAVDGGSNLSGPRLRGAWLRRGDRPGASTRLRIAAFPLRAVVGPNGSGKSWYAIYCLLPSLDAGRTCLSTVRILDFRNPRPCDQNDCADPAHPNHFAAHPNYVPLTDYRQLLEAHDTDILLDEVTGVASSRESASMPVQVANQLVQLRRRNNTLTWTSPNWARSDKIIREVTQVVTIMEGSMPVRRAPVPGAPPRIWRDNRLFWSRTYDAALYDDFDASRTMDNVRPLMQQLLWRPGALTDLAYDTLDPVLALGWANDAGICMHCGGKRSHPKCSCEAPSTVGKSARVVPAQGVSRAGSPAGSRRLGSQVTEV